MPVGTKSIRAVTMLMLLSGPLPGGSQIIETSLEDFVSQSVSETANLGSPTINEWAIRHPGEQVDAPAERNRDYDLKNARYMYDRKLEGRWCLRSTAQIFLANGIRVRRTALFYQPLVEQIYDKPLPALPTETGEALRQHGCRLDRILIEFDGITDPRNVVETIARLIPGERSNGVEYFKVNLGNYYWKPAYSFSSSDGFSYLYTHTDQHSALLLEQHVNLLDYGEPSKDTINPEAEQPWLPLRAALLARLPEAPTLAMLSFLAPQVGDQYERAPLYCDRKLIPVLREWMGLAAKSTPKQRAAALLLADQVLGRLSECEEFAEEPFNPSFETEDAWDDARDSLKKGLKELGIETCKSARPRPEEYSGNLLKQVPKLAPTGVVNELYWMAVLDDRCQWSPTTELDCTDLIKSGEDFLSRFPNDEWTPTVHLILAEAYAVTAADYGQGYSATQDPEEAQLEKEAAAHYRAWYAMGVNARVRALVWEEIWAIDAGMGPWLMVPSELRQ